MYESYYAEVYYDSNKMRTVDFGAMLDTHAVIRAYMLWQSNGRRTCTLYLRHMPDAKGSVICIFGELVECPS